MARLAAVEKGLYYPTPLRVIDLIAHAVRMPVLDADQPRRRLLDVCAGEGDAAARLADAWNLDAYGVELDVDRAAVASEKMKVCLQGSYHQLSTTAAFQVLFLNPPYDWGEHDGISSRQEVQFLFDAIERLQPGGLLVFIPPRHVLGLQAFRGGIRRYCDNIHAWSFPAPEVEAFDQVVVVARRALSNYGYGDISAIEHPGDLPVLDARSRYTEGFRLPFPVSLEGFELEGFDPVTNAPSWSTTKPTWGYASRQWDILVGDRGSLATRPLVAPRPGHQAMLLAAGALDGTELPGGQLLKGGSEKITVEFEEGEETIVRERIVSRLSVLDLATGDYENWRADEAPERTAEWFAEHGEDLARAIQTAYTPSFNGDLMPYLDALAKLRAPGILPGRTEPEFLMQQQEAAAATAFWLVSEGQKSVVISGEMGTGKTSMAIMATTLARLRKVIVMCPSHLVPKWIRECEKITGTKGIAVTAKKLSQVDAFFAGSARYLVLSKEMAKLGARWEPSFKTKTVIIEKEVVDHDADCSYGGYGYGSYRPVRKKTTKVRRNAVVCPDCGAPQTVSGLPLSPEAYDQKVQRRCLTKGCNAALWQVTPISSKGSKRWPLARYIRQHYRRRFALVLDECHQYAGANSDQSKAAQDLCSGASKILAMTGTLYGGRASSIFHLLFKVDPTFRQMYAYDECDRFVAHHGLFEERFETEERTSTYGYRRGGKRSGGRIREIPGMSPAMIPVLLPYSLFIKLKDLRLELPPYEEQVELLNLDEDILHAAQRLQGDVKVMIREHPDILGQYLMACLGYPDCPEQPEEIVSRNKETDDGPQGQTIVATAPAFEQRTLPKDRRVVEIVQEEKAKGRQVLVYFSQTHRRDARGRVKAALEDAGFKVKVLDANVPPDKREDWLERAQKDGFDVMLTNGRLVETGMDLLFAATIIQYGTEYSIPSLRQSIRRSWRLGQVNPIKVIFLAYAGTMQETALNLIARKMRAAEMVDGDESGGLAQFDESGTNFFLELAQEAVQAVQEGSSMTTQPKNIVTNLVPASAPRSWPTTAPGLVVIEDGDSCSLVHARTGHRVGCFTDVAVDEVENLLAAVAEVVEVLVSPPDWTGEQVPPGVEAFVEHVRFCFEDPLGDEPGDTQMLDVFDVLGA